MNFTFEFHRYGGDEESMSDTGDTIDHMNLSFQIDDAAPWDCVLEKFVQFLGNCYGYDISEKVEVKTLFGTFNLRQNRNEARERAMDDLFGSDTTA